MSVNTIPKAFGSGGSGLNPTADPTNNLQKILSDHASAINTLLAGGGGSGTVNSVVAGTNITVDATDPANPIVSATGGGGSGITQLTGDVTAGPGTGSQPATLATGAVTTAKIAASNVTLAKLANQADQTILGNNTGGAAAPLALTAAQTRTVLGLATVATSASAADLTTGALPAARMPALTGDVTASAGSTVTAIGAHKVTYGKVQQAAPSTLIGNPTVSTADVSEITLGSGLSFSGTILNSNVVASGDYYTALAAPATSIAQTGLNGNLDGDYLVDITLLCAVNTTSFKFQLQGADTALSNFSGSWLLGKAIRTDWALGSGSASPQTFNSGAELRIMGRLSARSGRVRQFSWEAMYVTAGAPADWFFFYGRYTDTTTNITSFGVVASQANGLNTGSYVRLTPLNTDK